LSEIHKEKSALLNASLATHGGNKDRKGVSSVPTGYRGTENVSSASVGGNSFNNVDMEDKLRRLEYSYKIKSGELEVVLKSLAAHASRFAMSKHDCENMTVKT